MTTQELVQDACLCTIRENRPGVALTAAINELLSAVLPMLKTWHRKNSQWIELDDVKQIASIAIIDAAAIYDPLRGTAMSLVWTCVERALVSEYRKHLQGPLGAGPVISIDTGYDGDGGLKCAIPDPHSTHDAVDLKDEARHWDTHVRQSLSKREFEVFLRRLQGQSCAAIAAELKITVKAVYWAMDRVQSKFPRIRDLEENQGAKNELLRQLAKD